MPELVLPYIIERVVDVRINILIRIIPIIVLRVHLVVEDGGVPGDIARHHAVRKCDPLFICVRTKLPTW